MYKDCIDNYEISGYTLRFEGNNFYPSTVKEKTKYSIKVLAEYGEISTKGRYKGKPSSYGLPCGHIF